MPLAAAALSLAAAAYMGGGVGVMAALGAAWVLGVAGSVLLIHALGERAASYDALQLLAICALPLSVSLAMPLRAMGVGVLLSALLAVFLFDPGSVTNPAATRDAAG